MSAHARHRAHHRKPRGATRKRQFRTGEVRRERGFGSGGTAARSMRPYAMAGVALVGASVIAVTPVAPPPPPEMRVASAEVRLAAAPSLLNVPVNLLIDIINIPHAEIQAIDLFARAQMFSGPWFIVSASNIWGIDPGDPPRFRAVVGMLAPFPALSGLYLDQNDQRGLGQQVWMLVAAELPVSRILRRRRLPHHGADEPHHRHQ